MPQFRTLRAISIAFALALSCATIFTGILVYFSLIAAIDRAVDGRMESEARELLYDDPDVHELVRRIASEAVLRDSGDIGYLLEQNGTILAQNIKPLHPLPIGLSTVGAGVGIPGLTRGRAMVIVRPDGLRLTMIIESEPIDRHDTQRLVILSAGFGTILLSMIVGVLALAWTIRRNIDHVRDTAEAIFEGDLNARVPVIGENSAFGRQAEAFNRMLDRIQDLMANLEGVSNDIAHDLRTPLARLRSKLARVMGKAEAARLEADLAEVLRESDEILAMFAAILRIAEVEGRQARSSFEHIELGKLAEDVSSSLEAMVLDSGRTLLQGPWAAVSLMGDRRLILQMIVNLIENAVNHTPVGSTISVSVIAGEQEIRLIVADNGPGIPESSQSQALRRFGRLEASRNRRGFGLGLPLINAIAHLHHGSLMLEDAGPGLRAVVCFPV